MALSHHITTHSQTVDNSTCLSLVQCLFSPTSLFIWNPFLVTFITDLVLCAHTVHEVSEVLGHLMHLSYVTGCLCSVHTD